MVLTREILKNQSPSVLYLYLNPNVARNLEEHAKRLDTLLLKDFRGPIDKIVIRENDEIGENGFGYVLIQNPSRKPEDQGIQMDSSDFNFLSDIIEEDEES